MKVIHCADLHLDSKMTTNLSKEQAKERKIEMLHTFQKMVSFAETHKIDVILIAGDLFDTRNVSVSVRNVVRDAIVMHPEIEFLYLKGNHDVHNFLSNLVDMPENLKLFGESWTSYRYHRVVFTGVELSSNNQLGIYNSLVLSYDDINIVTLHGQESDYRGGDKAEIIQLQELKNKNIDYLALGHVHGYKRATLDARGVYCYPGCLEGRGFDECGNKGFVLLEINEDTGKITDTFISFAERTLHTMGVDCSGLLTTTNVLEKVKEEVNYAISNQLLSEKDMVKIVLKGELDVDAEIDLDFLTRMLADCFYAVKFVDETRLHVDYRAYGKDESLKGEFVRLVESSELDEETKAKVIRCGILALSGEEV